MLIPSRDGEGGETSLAGVERSASGTILRMPRAEDGPAVTALIGSSPPLDVNSAYCNLLQCTDFRDTCVLAERDGEALRMLDELVARPAAASAQVLATTITETNDVSWALFRAFARRRDAPLAKSPRFGREAHFAGAHDTEWEARIALPPTS